MDFGQLSTTLLALLDSALMPKSCAYVAGPLESGQEYYEAIAAGFTPAGIRNENEQRLTLFARQLRERLRCPVFDPGILKVPGWTDAEHGIFFLLVVEKYAKEVWFLDGWEFSHGATKEFVHCLKVGISCRNEVGDFITPDAGRLLIRRAAEHVERLGADASRLRSRLA